MALISISAFVIFLLFGIATSFASNDLDLQGSCVNLCDFIKETLEPPELIQSSAKRTKWDVTTQPTTSTFNMQLQKTCLVIILSEIKTISILGIKIFLPL